MSTRSYGQFCGLTRGADLLGGRWTLPIIRDLLLGPARFSDLLAGFPGIPTNQLSTRLKEMEADGIIRRALAPRGTRYELTEWGRALEPVITEIGRWGAARMEQPAEGEIVTEAGLATSLRTSFAGRLHPGPATPTTFEISANDLVAHATVQENSIEVSTGPSEAPTIVISAGEHFLGLVTGKITADEYQQLPGVTIHGDVSLLQEFTELFRITPIATLHAA